MNKVSYLIFFAVIAADLINAATFTFRADYEAVYSSFHGSGAVPGSVSYHYDSSILKNSVVRFDHTVYGINNAKTTITEFEDYSSERLLKICPGNCEGYPLSRSADPWWFKSGDSCVQNDKFVADDGVTYYRCDRNSGKKAGIKSLYLKSGATTVSNPTVADIAARIVFNDGQNVTLKKNTITILNSPDSKFTIPANAGCVVKKCKSYLDIVFVLDESGSINANEFSQMRTFLRALAGNVTIGYDAGAVAITMFGEYGRTVFDLTYASVDGKIQNFARDSRNSGWTRQGLGLEKAYAIVTADNERRQKLGKPAQFVIALTDGVDHNYGNLQTQANKLKNYGVFLMEVGVGISSSYATKLAGYASTLNGKAAYFDVKDFQSLLNTINEIVVPICDNSNSSMCDPMCHGYCGCGLSCYCPTCTPTGTKCDENTCTVVGNTTQGCVERSTKPTLACSVPKCDAATGWDVSEKVVCDPEMKTCEEQVCAEPGGCKTSLKLTERCTELPDKCHVASCDPTNANANSTTGCVYTNKCTGESDSRIMYGSVYGCINYKCQDGRCVEEDACQGNATVDSCMAMQCNRKTHKCEIAGAGTGECTTDDSCPVKDSCSTPSCTGGKCSYTPIYDLPEDCNGCYKAQCNEQTHHYELVYVGCGNTDKCMQEKCVNNTGVCSYEPRFPYLPCFDIECDKVTGAGRGYVPRNCSNPEMEAGSCIRFRCNNQTDMCEKYQEDPKIACYTDNPLCVDVSCSKQGAMCEYTNRTAPGVTQCRFSRCDPTTGNLSLYDKCDDGRLCTIDSCDYEGNCSYRPNYCENMPTGNMSSCFFWSCSESRKNGCYRKIYDNAFFDECGNCIGPYDDTRNLTDNELTDCKKALTWEEKAAVISAGVAGAIVAACIIGAIGVSVGGTLLTRELIKRARAAADSGAVENPMYQDNGREMSNPAFEGEDMDS